MAYRVLHDLVPANLSSLISLQWPLALYSAASLNLSITQTPSSLLLCANLCVMASYNSFNKYSLCYCINHDAIRKEMAYSKGRTEGSLMKGLFKRCKQGYGKSAKHPKTNSSGKLLGLMG